MKWAFCTSNSDVRSERPLEFWFTSTNWRHTWWVLRTNSHKEETSRDFGNNPCLRSGLPLYRPLPYCCHIWCGNLSSPSFTFISLERGQNNVFLWKVLLVPTWVLILGPSLLVSAHQWQWLSSLPGGTSHVFSSYMKQWEVIRVCLGNVVA